MNDKIETQGKTVEEAINEALLRLGARRDEVDVTVLDEPKSGFLGFLGGKPARVEVSRKGGRRRGPRQGGGNQAHEFGEGSGDGNRRRRSSRSRRPRNDRREKDEGETRQAEGRSRQEHQNDKDNRRNENRQDGDGKSRGRRRRRPRKPRTDGVEAQNQSQNQSQNRNQNENRANRREDQGRGRRERPAAAKVGAAGAKKADQPTEAVKDPRRTRSRNQRGRRRGENGLASDVGRSAEIVAAEVAPAEVIPTETMNKVEADGNTIQPETSRQRPRHEDGGREDGGRNNRGRGTRRRDSRRSDPRRTEAGPGEASEPRTENSQEDVVIETIAKGIPATKYAQATRDVSAEDINSAIEKLTGGVLVRAGFPARCEVNRAARQHHRFPGASGRAHDQHRPRGSGAHEPGREQLSPASQRQPDRPCGRSR